MVNGIVPGYEYDPEHCILLGVDRASEGMVPLDYRKFNRHGFIGGATGTGKTVTIRNLIEGLSQFGIPSLTVDAKGDLSGMIREGKPNEKQQARIDLLDQYFWEPTSLPVAYIAPGGNGYGVPAKVNVHSFPVKSLARVLELTPAQTRNLKTAFREGNGDSARPIETLEDLNALLEGMRDNAEMSLSDAMAARIIEAVLNLQESANGLFGGGPEFDVMDLVKADEFGFGQVNIIDSSQLKETPAIVTTFLLWVLDQLAKSLPEVGDAELKLVVFLDEAHLLFKRANTEFVDSMVSTVKTLRSKGVGIFFCSQSDGDIPEDVMQQCAARIQHALRVNTHKQQLAVNHTKDNFPLSETYDIPKEIKGMGTGQALVSVLDDDGFASPPALTVVYVPRSLMEPVDEDEIRKHVAAHPLTAKYRRMFEEWNNERRERRYIPTVVRTRPVEALSGTVDLRPYPEPEPSLTERLRAAVTRRGSDPERSPSYDEWETSATVE